MCTPDHRIHTWFGFVKIKRFKKPLRSWMTEVVYDLHVEGPHEYFANGILVHNCSDAADYMITAVFSEYMNKYSKQRGMRRAN